MGQATYQLVQDFVHQQYDKSSFCRDQLYNSTFSYGVYHLESSLRATLVFFRFTGSWKALYTKLPFGGGGYSIYFQHSAA